MKTILFCMIVALFSTAAMAKSTIAIVLDDSGSMNSFEQIKPVLESFVARIGDFADVVLVPMSDPAGGRRVIGSLAPGPGRRAMVARGVDVLDFTGQKTRFFPSLKQAFDSLGPEEEYSCLVMVSDGVPDNSGRPAVSQWALEPDDYKDIEQSLSLAGEKEVLIHSIWLSPAAREPDVIKLDEMLKTRSPCNSEACALQLGASYLSAMSNLKGGFFAKANNSKSASEKFESLRKRIEKEMDSLKSHTGSSSSCESPPPADLTNNGRGNGDSQSGPFAACSSKLLSKFKTAPSDERIFKEFLSYLEEESYMEGKDFNVFASVLEIGSELEKQKSVSKAYALWITLEKTKFEYPIKAGSSDERNCIAAFHKSVAYLNIWSLANKCAPCDLPSPRQECASGYAQKLCRILRDDRFVGQCGLDKRLANSEATELYRDWRRKTNCSDEFLRGGVGR